MILVTGGTGLVGAHLLFALLQSKDKVRATHRASSDLNAIKKVFDCFTSEGETLYNKIEWVEANITEIPALTNAFEGITHVYHCAAYISFDPKNYYKLKKSNIEGTANVVNLCLSKGIEKLCYVSSIATLGHTLDNSAIDEDTDWNPEDNNSVYAITKFGAEMEVWRGIQEGLKAVIVNPGVILGEGFWDSGSGKLIKNAAKGATYYTDGSSGFVDVQDVVTVLIDLMKSDITRERYVLVGSNLNYRQFLVMITKEFKVTQPSKKMSRGFMVFFSKMDYFSSKLFGSKRLLPKPLVESMFTHSVYDASKIENTLGFTFTPIEETIQRVVSNY